MTQPAIITKTIPQAMNLLTAAGCQYKIISPDGTEYGQLESVKPKKRHHTVPPGTYAKYFVPFLQDVKIGDVACIPFGPHDKKALSGAVTAWCSDRWGKGSYKSCSAGDHYQVLRCE